MKLTQAILPVAGLGTRFLPWTKVVPKELLPIGNQPIIALLVDECLSVGIHDICFVINRGKEMIPQYFYDMPSLERELQKRGKLHMLRELARYHNVNFHVVYQDSLLGDGHALLQAKSWVVTESVAILFGDDLITGNENGLQQLVKGLEHLCNPDNTAMLCLQEVEPELTSKYGIVEIDEKWSAESLRSGGHSAITSRLRKIRSLVEKPKPEDAPGNLGIVGKYIIPKNVFDLLHRMEEGNRGSSEPALNGIKKPVTDMEIRLIDALIERNGLEIYGYVFEGARFDIGTPEGYKEAVKALG